MNSKTFLSYTFILLSAFTLSSCDDDEPDTPIIPNEEEVITTLNLTLINQAPGGDTAIFSFRDLDGDGGNPPVITEANLLTGSTYTATVEFLNELESPAEDITVEVIEEALEHQVFYVITTPGVAISYSDQDANGNPLGVLTEISTLDPSSGTLRVILRHEPDKNAAGVSMGDIENAGGETDIEVVFNLDVE